MLYAIFCYDSEAEVGAWTKERDAEAMTNLTAVTDKLAQAGKLGPVVRLLPTTTATTLRKGRENIVLDGPFAETKEQLLGFFVVDCKNLDEAIDAARQLAGCYSSSGCYEIRPVGFFNPGVPVG